jgi:hypothetical protein
MGKIYHTSAQGRHFRRRKIPHLMQLRVRKVCLSLTRFFKTGVFTTGLNFFLSAGIFSSSRPKIPIQPKYRKYPWNSWGIHSTAELISPKGLVPWNQFHGLSKLKNFASALIVDASPSLDLTVILCVVLPCRWIWRCQVEFDSLLRYG